MTDENRPSLVLSVESKIGLTKEAGAICGMSVMFGMRCKYTVLFSRSAWSKAAPRLLFRILKDSFRSPETDLRSFLAASRIFCAS